MGKDSTEYYLLTKDYVSVENFDGKEVLKVEPEALTRLANAPCEMYRSCCVASIMRWSPAYCTTPRRAITTSMWPLPCCGMPKWLARVSFLSAKIQEQPLVMGKKGQQVWTGGGDEEALSLGVYKTYTEENLRYSQNAPLDMYREVNTGCNLPAQIDLYAVDGMEYKFLFIAKGGGSANKTYLYQETKALITAR